MTLDQALQLALTHHAAGREADAEAIYRQLVGFFPNQASALHWIGLKACEAGHVKVAIELIGRALELDGSVPEFHSNLGECYRRVGDWPRAIAALRHAIALGPGLPEAHHSLGLALSAAGETSAAIAAFESAIALRPDHFEAWNHLGNALLDQGRNDEAMAAYRRALEIRPGFALAESNLGNVLRKQGRLDEAIAAYRRAIGFDPGSALAHNNLGNALLTRGRPDEAIAAYRRAIEIQPGFATAHSNLGNALRDQGRFDEAVGVLSRAIVLDPDCVEAYNNLGNTLKDNGRLDEAAAAFERAVALRPQFAEARNNLGGVLLLQGDQQGALRAFERALADQPDFVAAHSNLLMCRQYQIGATPETLRLAHEEWDERHAQPLRAGWKNWDLDRDPERPLRLAFVSSELRQHPVGFFLVRVLENLDPQSCSAFCYYSRTSRDAMSRRIAAAATAWRDVAGFDDEALASQIRDDRIDILFDLSGHTSDQRLVVFARRPAPIQITWIGYVGTTGLKAIDCLIADRHHVPPGAEVHYVERVLRMPDGYVCYAAPHEAAPVGPLPALAQGRVTFGSFNNLAKISPAVLAVWARIVQRVPGSRLVLVSPPLDSRGAQQRIADAFVAAGGDRARLELRGYVPWFALLAAYNTIDVALDPFPYSGGLTTCEALWMGVPVVACPGATFAGRHSLSHLSNVGLTETIAADLDDYVERAVGLAGDLPRLAALRAGLRGRMDRSPLCDGPRFARNFTACLRDVWRHWCQV
jgi:predicted O-linked N-acetylglucosamine transferase (SPINDLY family)